MRPNQSLNRTFCGGPGLGLKSLAQTRPATKCRLAQTLGLTISTCGVRRVKTANSNLAALRVAKTYAPDQNGAKRFARRYPDQLVCVRHRLSDDGSVRHTTVELLIESTPVASRARTLVAVKIGPTDKAIRTLLMACGAQWMPKDKYWLLPRMVAKNLRLLKNVVPNRG